MTIDSYSAILDNDFLNHALEMADTGDPAEALVIIDKVFKALELNPFVHPLVYLYEVLKDKKIVQDVFNSGIISRSEFQDIHNNEQDKIEYYSYLVKELYRRMTGFSEDFDVYTYWKMKSSLGEVHSVAASLTTGCNVFLSDDNDSKKLKSIVDRMPGNDHIDVYSREEVVSLIKEKNTDSELSRHELRRFKHKP